MKTLLLLAAAAVPFPLAEMQTPTELGAAPVRHLLTWMPEEVRCEGTSVKAAAMLRPLTALQWGSRDQEIARLRYRFRIDESGRPLSIRRHSAGVAPGSEDVAPSLAASRFAAGAPRADCTIAYAPRLTLPADSPVGDLISYSLTPLSGKLPPEGWARIAPETSCRIEPRPRPLAMRYPDYDRIPAAPGAKDWSMVAYDLNASGRPIRVRTTHSTGNAALDAAAVKAMRASRFTGGARTGCGSPFARGPVALAAPAVPEASAQRPPDGSCPHDGGWATAPVLRYPKAYQRRSIEGWATVMFDVAPWGELGNLRVLASEPSADFGDHALQVLRSARKQASNTGRTGCVEHVQFKMGYGGLPPEEPGA
ncbi:energy transducer TonB [Sphingomonas sp. ac-8]|uniref:energy transducer TonB n=1 Tax=Sphingomonas sp. ac-8 TaxID=3242977 RepID=UPI003A7FDA67